MVRKDVKLGFIIGGVLLAVVVVYVLVASGDNGKKKGAELTKLDPSQIAPTQANTDASSESASNNAQTGDVTPPAPQQPVAQNQQPTAPDQAKPSDAVAKNTNDPFAANSKDDDRWLMALNHGQMPTLMGTTQSPAQQENAAAPTTKPSNENSGSDVIADPPAEPINESHSSVASTQPSKMHTHVVQKGETLSKISAAAYGNSAYWPHILRANPGLIDKKLRPGMTINLPDAADVKAEGTPNSVASNSPSTQPSASAAPIDGKTQYRVVTGDSLQKISTKLYGKAELWEKIYDANKDKIGADPAKLKLNTVLKLPQAPTVTQ
jgi:nucleoid-associated protein YgaU